MDPIANGQGSLARQTKGEGSGVQSARRRTSVMAVTDPLLAERVALCVLALEGEASW